MSTASVSQIKKFDDVYSGYLRTSINGKQEDCFVRVDDVGMHVLDSAQSETYMEVNLKKSAALCLHKPNEFSFVIVTLTAEMVFTASSYARLIEWVAVINSVSSSLSPELVLLNHSAREMYENIFEREYQKFLVYLNSPESRQLLFDSEFSKLVTTRSTCSLNSTFGAPLLRSPSVEGDLIKYDADAAVKSPFAIAGITLDKLVERLTDVCGPDPGFIKLVLHSHRCFTDSIVLMHKLIARMNVKSGSGEVEAWKPIIKLRSISVIYKWMCSCWESDFGRVDMKEAVQQFLMAISSPFADDSAQDTSLDDIYLVKFNDLLEQFQFKLSESDRVSSTQCESTSEGPLSVTSAT
ncbi:hypothetical protein HDU91_003570, partial [Kappamyces sp. JEL0680]